MIIDVVLHLIAISFTITEMVLSAILLIYFKKLDSEALRAKWLKVWLMIKFKVQTIHLL